MLTVSFQFFGNLSGNEAGSLSLTLRRAIIPHLLDFLSGRQYPLFTLIDLNKRSAAISRTKQNSLYIKRSRSIQYNSENLQKARFPSDLNTS